MLSRLSLVMPLAKLLFDFLGNDINRRVKVGLHILRKKVRSGERNSHRTGKLAVGCFGLVVLQRYTDVGCVLIKMIQLINAGDEMIFDCFGQRQVVSRKDQIHPVS